MKPYSEDLRVRVVGRVEAGHPVREVAETFGVSVSSVVKWSQRKRQTGSVAAKPMGSGLARSLAAQRDWMLARITEKPDVTLRELVAELQARAVTTSYGSVWRLLNDEGISFKKAFTPASKTGLTSPADGCAGRRTKAGSTPPGWSSSTRPGPRPT